MCRTKLGHLSSAKETQSRPEDIRARLIAKESRMKELRNPIERPTAPRRRRARRCNVTAKPATVGTQRAARAAPMPYMGGWRAARPESMTINSVFIYHESMTQQPSRKQALGLIRSYRGNVDRWFLYSPRGAPPVHRPNRRGGTSRGVQQQRVRRVDLAPSLGRMPC